MINQLNRKGKQVLYLTIFLSFFCSLCSGVSPVEFQKAAINGDRETLLRGLEEKGTQYCHLLDKELNTPLHLAACAKKGGSKTELIALLLKYGADPNATNRHLSTPLYIAVATQNLEGAKLLLNHPNIKPNELTSANMTPLIAALATRSEEMLKLLLSHPLINPNQEDTDGMTPLHLAAKWGLESEAELLLSHPKTDPSPRQIEGDFMGATPLHHAAMQAHTGMIKLLLNLEETQVNAKISKGLYAGYTPLHYAVMNPNTLQVFESLKLLIGAGADLHLKTEGGKLPIDLTDVQVIQEFLKDPNLSYQLKKKTRIYP
jgi:ankyrin repeat protein